VIQLGADRRVKWEHCYILNCIEPASQPNSAADVLDVVLPTSIIV